MPTNSQDRFDLMPHWLVCAVMLLLIMVYNLVCHVYPAQIRSEIDPSQRILLRSVLYALAIIAFPLAKLMRHILLRLNQTVPGAKSAAQRYFSTVLITQFMIATVTLFGPIMFALGDEYNTLYIYSVLGVLGIFLHRPNLGEYHALLEALAHKNQ